MIAGLDGRVLEREGRLPQPGRRAPAPGELVLLQSFVNTHFDLVEEWGADLLRTPERLRDWFSRRGLLEPGMGRLTEAHVRRVIAVREGLRQLAHRNGEPSFQPDRTALARMNDVAQSASLGLSLDPDRLVLAPRGTGMLGPGLGMILTIAAQAMVDGRWLRLKACPGEHCGWMFYDHSRNNSGRWCSMAVCGGRTKARTHYRRQRMGSTEQTRS